MKLDSLFILTVFFLFIINTGDAQNKESSDDLLEITGAALLNDEKTSDYSISLYLDGVKTDSLYSKSKKVIRFYVEYNKVYTFLFQKENYQNKIVIVNTKLPDGLKELKDDTFDFEVEMSQSLSKNTEELKDYPVAVLLIDKKNEALQASADYNKFTHTKPKVITSKIQK